MAKIVIMPKLGATMDEGRIIRWFVKEGESVSKGAPLLEVESDKATLEVESPATGTLLKILYHDGDIPVLQPIGVIGIPGEDISGLAGLTDTAGEPGAAVAGRTGEGGLSEDGTSKAGDAGMPEAGKYDERAESGGSIKSTPGAKRIAKENNIDLKYVTPGKNGNGIITGSDVERYIRSAGVEATPVAARIAEINNIPLDRVEHSGRKIYKADVLRNMQLQEAEKQSAPSPETGTVMQSGGRMQKMGNVRRKTAERMTKTWQTVPMATNAVEVDASNALSLCERINMKISVGGFKVNLTDILLKVLAVAVARNPEVNAFIDGEMIVYRDEVNVSFAVALDNGLVVPVIKNADRMGLMQINAAKRDLASRAKEGKLAIDEMNGGSITLTNMGSFGEGIFFPIINAPELCIVGTGRVTKKPVAVGDEIIIKPMMWVTLTFDHRVIDGVPAAKLLSEIKDMIETPELLIG